MDATIKDGIGAVLGRVPSGLFVLTTRHEDRRAGMLASWVQQVCFEPAMVSVAVGKGRLIMTLIRESRCFGLCQLPKDDRVLMRKFSGAIPADEDPFLGYGLVDHTATGVPILRQCLGYLECHLSHHLDVDGDHDLLVGAVAGGAVLDDGEPYVHLRKNGYRY